MLVSVKLQHESAIGIPISPSFWTSLPSPTPSHPSRLVQSPCLGFLRYTASSFWHRESFPPSCNTFLSWLLWPYALLISLLDQWSSFSLLFTRAPVAFWYVNTKVLWSAALHPLCFSLLSIKKYLFIWLHQVWLQQGEFWLGHVNSWVWHVGSSFLTRDWTQTPAAGSAAS